MMIAVGVELTCYYYSFLFAVAFLYEKKRGRGHPARRHGRDRLHRLGADEVPAQHRLLGQR